MTEHSACNEIRLALGVYVVGAIDPAERSAVDMHLSQCAACRRELAGLAGLPALLGRVPARDVEQLAAAGSVLPGAAEPPPELLDSLLHQVAARRRVHRWRTITAAAAAAVLVVGGGLAGGAAISHAASHQPATAVPQTGPPVPQVAPGTSGYETEDGTNAKTHVTAVVAYYPSSWGTSMRVWVTGVPAGTTCTFWVVDKQGHWSAAGGWTEVAGQQDAWYTVSTSVSGASIKGFKVTAGHHLLVSVPAS